MKTKLYLLTGFLGSGKTTFLKSTLNDIKGKKTGVIMNEFGKTGIDGDIIRKDGMELIEINKGSIFCSCLQLNFVQALVELGGKGLDYVFVESSGLADPSNISDFLEATEANAGDVYEYCGSITLIDGVNFLDQVDDIETVNRQLVHAHLALISKVDLIDDKKLEEIIAKVKSINPNVLIALSNNGKTDFDFLNEDLTKSGFRESEETTNTQDTKPKTLTLTYKGETTKEKFVDFLNLIMKDTYRMKGFFKLDGVWQQVDVVGRNIDFKDTEVRDEDSKLVIISRIGIAIIKPIFEAFKNTVNDEMTLR